MGQMGLMQAILMWLRRERSVESAVLFGSSAHAQATAASAGHRSDLDLHIVTVAPAKLESIDWGEAVPSEKFCFQVVRPATGGVRKVTALFASGQIDMVLVPAPFLRGLREAVDRGRHRHDCHLRSGLNEMSTCLATGYRFLKGEELWGEFYSRVARTMPGVRLDDVQLIQLANEFLCDALWVLQKIENGEVAAAQHALHRQLGEVNFRLLRERRLRCREPLPSFGLGRRVETLLSPNELSWVQIDARPVQAELRRATLKALAGLRAQMRKLVPAWKVPIPMLRLLERASTKLAS